MIRYFLSQVSSVHLIKAEKIFGSLSFAATSNLSQFRLVSLLEQAKQLTGTKETSKKKQSKTENKLNTKHPTILKMTSK